MFLKATLQPLVSIIRKVNIFNILLLEKVIPGTQVTYHEAIILNTRDYLVDNGLSLKQLVNADMVRYIRVYFFLLSQHQKSIFM